MIHTTLLQRRSLSLEWNWVVVSNVSFSRLFGCFRKWGYPQIIHFNRVFHYKPSILGYPIFGNTHLGKIPLLTNIFQTGWNHQVGKCGAPPLGEYAVCSLRIPPFINHIQRERYKLGTPAGLPTFSVWYQLWVLQKVVKFQGFDSEVRCTWIFSWRSKSCCMLLLEWCHCWFIYIYIHFLLLLGCGSNKHWVSELKKKPWDFATRPTSKPGV